MMLLESDALAIAAAVRTRQVSAKEVAEQFLKQIGEKMRRSTALSLSPNSAPWPRQRLSMRH